MSMLQFSDEELEQYLEVSAPTDRVAFAAACTERLFPGYGLYFDMVDCDPDMAARRALDLVWESLPSKQQDTSIIDQYIEILDDLNQDETDEYLHQGAIAENALFAMAYTLECLKMGGSIQEAVWVANCAYETLHNYLLNQSDSSSITDVLLQEINDNDLIQTELKRQQRDLEELKNRAVSIDDLRKRSVLESETFLPWHDIMEEY